MPKYRYSAVDSGGKMTSGEIEADSAGQAGTLLQSKNLNVLDLQELGATPFARPVPAPHPAAATAAPQVRPLAKAAPAAEAPRHPVGVSFGGAVSQKAVTVFTRQLAATLNAGLPLLKIFRSMQRQTSNPAMTKMVDSLTEAIVKGRRLSDALGMHPGVFDDTYINMVRVGESGGNLAECMARLALMREKSESNARKMRSAMSYPVFILIFSLAMCYALLTFLMPMFIPMIEDAGLDLDRDYPITVFLFKASHVVASWTFFVWMAGIFACLWAFFKFGPRIKSVRTAMDWVRLNPPIVGNLVRLGITSRFARGLSLLLASGVSVVGAINLLAEGAGNSIVSARLRAAAASIENGIALSKALDGTKLFPEMLLQMVSMGEEAGAVPEMLERTGVYYEEEMDAAITTVNSMLEPVMMIFIGAIVATFVMGVLLPILGIAAQKRG